MRLRLWLTSGSGSGQIARVPLIYTDTRAMRSHKKRRWYGPKDWTYLEVLSFNLPLRYHALHGEFSLSQILRGITFAHLLLSGGIGVDWTEVYDRQTTDTA